MMPPDIKSLCKKIQSAKTLLLTTHKNCDGDGLGAQLGLFHALKKTGKAVRVMCVDAVPKKYRFLGTDHLVEVFEAPHKELTPIDLTLIFDTNDRRLVEPLFSKLQDLSKDILFIDHHPILNLGPEPTSGSYVNTRAASTGEIAFYLIKALGIHLDENIARAIYTSIVFDTQLFRYVRNSPSSHLISAELLEYDIRADEIHKHLFANYSKEKIRYLAKVFSEIEFFDDDKVAILKVRSQDLQDFNLDMDDSRDLVDIIMNISSVQAAALFREDAIDNFKISLRSKGHIEILGVAESFQGGGHRFAAGALIHGEYEAIRKNVVAQLMQRLNEYSASDGKKTQP